VPHHQWAIFKAEDYHASFVPVFIPKHPLHVKQCTAETQTPNLIP